MTTLAASEIHRYSPSEADAWRAFLKESENGTLFHDLEFLAYHPANRFDTHHLVCMRRGKISAVFPAAVVLDNDGRHMLKSPYGASVGGPALKAGQRAATTLEIVRQIQGYAADQMFDGIEIRLGPNIYSRSPNDTLSFALAAANFDLTHRWLEHVIPLPADPDDVLQLLRAQRRTAFRSSLREGLEVAPATADELGRFYRVLQANRSKHNAQPTHSLAELERIFELTPDRVQLFLCMFHDEIAAGMLVFELNDRVAYMFYLCHDERFDRYRPAGLITVRVAQHYALRGFGYLDLGPTTFDDFQLHTELAVFKEEMGGVGLCRDTWRWVRP